jgi:REP element-mobilizing transposase RayT
MHLECLDDDIEVIRANVQLDHVHMVAMIPPRIAVASVIQFIKSKAGKLMPEKFPYCFHAATLILFVPVYCVPTCATQVPFGFPNGNLAAVECLNVLP